MTALAGGSFLPERVDQTVRRDDLAGAQEQQREQRPLLARADLERLPVLRHLERAEDAELQRGVTIGQAAHSLARLKRCASGVQALLKRTRHMLGPVGLAWEVEMSITKGLRWFVVLALLLRSPRRRATARTRALLRSEP